MRTWWISISSKSKGFLGVVILDSASRDWVIRDIMKVSGIKDAMTRGFMDWEIHEIDSDGQDAKSFPKGKLISRSELDAKQYRPVRTCQQDHVSRN